MHSTIRAVKDPTVLHLAKYAGPWSQPIRDNSGLRCTHGLILTPPPHRKSCESRCKDVCDSNKFSQRYMMWSNFSTELIYALQEFGGAQTNLTHLEFIYFWISSIIAHASPPAGTAAKSQFSPRIFIVGTHRDSLPGSEGEKKQQVVFLCNSWWGILYGPKMHSL